MGDRTPPIFGEDSLGLEIHRKEHLEHPMFPHISHTFRWQKLLPHGVDVLPPEIKRVIERINNL